MVQGDRTWVGHMQGKRLTRCTIPAAPKLDIFFDLYFFHLFLRFKTFLFRVKYIHRNHRLLHHFTQDVFPHIPLSR